MAKPQEPLLQLGKSPATGGEWLAAARYACICTLLKLELAAYQQQLAAAYQLCMRGYKSRWGAMGIGAQQ